MADSALKGDGFATALFSFVGDSVERAQSALLLPVTERAVDMAQHVAQGAVLLWIVLALVNIGLGRNSRPVGEYLVATAYLVIVVTLVSTVDLFGAVVIGFFQGFEQDLARVFGGEEAAAASAEVGAIFATLDAALSRSFDAASVCLLNAEETSILAPFASLGWNLAGLIVMVSGALLTFFAAGAIISAKFAIALLFAIGPLCILAGAFPITRRFLELWVAQVLAAILVVTFVGATLTFSSFVYLDFIGRISFDGDMHPMIVAGILLGVSWFMYYLTKRSGTYAAGLSGGMAASAVGAAESLGRLAGTGKTVGRLVNPMETRRDLKSGHLVQASRLRHFAIGNTPVNSNYRSAVYRNATAGWRQVGGSAENKTPAGGKPSP